MLEIIIWILLGLAVLAVLIVATPYVYWRVVSVYRIRRAGPRPLRTRRKALWRDPGAVEQLDFRIGPGGTKFIPKPPFRFVKEHDSGTNPSLSVKDARGHTWRVKWGDEVNSETFAVRFAWAAGYFAEVTHFIAEGQIEDVQGLVRARACVGEDCRFTNARFELEEKGVTKMFDEHSWAWNDNPFVGTRELNGLKILVMLLSNWDNKDVRDVARGSNTAIFQVRLPNGKREARYLITDWGAALGRWASVVFREKWNCALYEAQNAELIKGVEEGLVQWGFIGQRTDDAVVGISVDDVRWLMQYIGRITDEQLREGLRASGATAAEVVCFTHAIRDRISRLRELCETV